MSGRADLDPDDATIATLDRWSRAGAGTEGGAVRDLAPGGPVLHADGTEAVRTVRTAETS